MDLYRQMVLEKYVRVNRSNRFSILTYSELAQFEQKWNEVTRQCRGLVIDDHMNVLARPWDKFMNYGLDPLDEKLMDWPVEVTDKLDGSLGIWFGVSSVYPPEDRRRVNYIGTDERCEPDSHTDWHMVTKGSFISDQALRGEKMMKEKYQGGYLDPAWTYMFEIIYPENRIVLDYDGMDELVLLGARNIETGFVRPAKDVTEWYRGKVATFPYKTLREAVEAPDRANAEGFVVYFPDFDYRIKIKQEDYMKLHREVTGLTSRKIWKRLKNGEGLDVILDVVPDEWHEWLKVRYDKILTDFLTLHDEIYGSVEAALAQLPKDISRQDLAIVASIIPYGNYLFAIYDSKNLHDEIWDLVKPPADPK